MADFTINNAWLTEFDAVFQDFLVYQGGTLIGGTEQETVVGESKLIRQATVGDAHFITGSGTTTEYATQSYDRRRLTPRDFAHATVLDDVDLRMMGTPNIDQIARGAANACGKLIDQIIIEGISGKSYSEANGGDVTLPSTPTGSDSSASTGDSYDATQVIPWCDYRFGDNANGWASKTCKAGLNSSKLTLAVEKLRSKFNYGAIVCIGSERAMSTLRTDPKASNADFNYQRTLADGQFTTPFCGIDAFIPCELVEKNQKSFIKADGVIGKTGEVATGATVEYAYIYCVPQIKLGVGAPLSLKEGMNAERYLNNTLIYKGAYGCTRMFEEAVVKVEVCTTAPATDLAAWNY